MSINFKKYMRQLNTMPVDDQIRKVAKDMRATPADMLDSTEIAVWIEQNRARIIKLSTNGKLGLE